MTDSEGHTATRENEAISVPLRPIHGKRGAPWSADMDGDVLSLLAPDGRLVMMLPREEAAGHLSFEWDLLRGRTVSFSLVEGLKKYRFKCSAGQLRKLAAWLPSKSREEMDKETRYYGIALVVFGVGQLLFREQFHWGWGLAFVVMGLACLASPRQVMYMGNGLLLLTAGLAFLFLAQPAVSSPEFVQALVTGLGSLFLLWGIQQFSLLGVNHRLRAARAHRYSQTDDGEERPPSRVVRIVGYALAIVSLLCVLQVGGLFAQIWLAERTPALQEWILCGTLAGLSLGMTAALLLRRNATYIEAKVAGQFAAVFAVIRFAGTAVHPLDGTRLPFDPSVLSDGVFFLSSPRVWVPLVLLVLAFNWWFGRAVTRELRERGQ